MIRMLIAVGLISLVVGCATNYKDSGLTGGYTETRLDENIWTVRFRSNAYTGRQKTADFCMLRCAELCIENGFNYFVIASADSDTSISTHTTPSTSYTTGNAYTSGNMTFGNATTTTYGGDSYTMSKPSNSNTIVCFKEKPEGTGIAYSAKFVTDSIRTKYKLNK